MHQTPDAPAPGDSSTEATAEAVPSLDTVQAAAHTPTAASASAEPASAEPASAASQAGDLPPAACAARLADLFPAVFTAGQPQPLKLRIQADIQELVPGIFTRKSLSAFLHRHTTSTAYLRALVGAPNRIDLAGQPAGEVAPEHRDAATLELQRRRELFEARRAAERQAQFEAQRSAQRAAQRTAQDQPRPVHADPDAALAATALQVDTRHAPAAPGANRRPAPAHRDPRRAPAAQREAPGARTAQEGRHSQPRPDNSRRVQTAPAAQTPPPAQAPQGPRAPVPAQIQASQDPQRRERQALLRAFESTTLTRRNFCALKGISEAELDAQLALARQDAAPVQAAPEMSPQSQPRRAATPAPRANRS